MWGFSSTIASSLLIFVFDLYIFSNAWIVWVLIFPILIFFMPIFSTPLFGINQFWTAPASILLFPGVCSAGQPSAGWPKSSPGWLPPRTDMARFLEGGSTNFGSGSELQGGGAPALQCQIYVYVLSLCKYIVKSGRKKYKFEDPVQPLLHNNEQKFDNKFRSQAYLIRCNSLSGGPMPPWM